LRVEVVKVRLGSLIPYYFPEKRGKALSPKNTGSAYLFLKKGIFSVNVTGFPQNSACK